jgi:polar amino acid transport system substrate-binding protein
MKVECEFITQDWDGIIPALNAGRYDADHRLHVDHRRAQAAGRLHKQYYYNTPAGHCRAEGFQAHRSNAGSAGRR